MTGMKQRLMVSRGAMGFWFQEDMYNSMIYNGENTQKMFITH